MQVEEYEFQCNELKIEMEFLPQDPAELERNVKSLEDELLQIHSDCQQCADTQRKELKTAADKLEEQNKK